MGISVGCQVLSRLLDKLFRDLKQKFVHNFMDDLVVYSSFLTERLGHLEEVFKSLEKAGVTLNPDKLRLALEEILFLGNLCRLRELRFCPSELMPLGTFHLQRTLRGCVSFWKWRCSMDVLLKVSL
jgi:hypothetical protein